MVEEVDVKSCRIVPNKNWCYDRHLKFNVGYAWRNKKIIMYQDGLLIIWKLVFLY